MSFENSAGIDVSNHYGPRAVGGTVGSKATDDNKRIYNLDLDAAADSRTPADVTVVEGTIVEEVYFAGTEGTATVSVGAQEITDATYAVPVVVSATGNLVYTKGTGAGTPEA